MLTLVPEPDLPNARLPTRHYPYDFSLNSRINPSLSLDTLTKYILINIKSVLTLPNPSIIDIK